MTVSSGSRVSGLNSYLPFSSRGAAGDYVDLGGPGLAVQGLAEPEQGAP
jgi:hypothetical protein